MPSSSASAAEAWPFAAVRAPSSPKELTAKMKAFLEALKPELELADKYDSYLAVENHGHALLDGPDSFKAFVDLNQRSTPGYRPGPACTCNAATTRSRT